MRKKTSISKTLLPLAGLLASACSSIDCPVQNTVAINYGVCQMEGDAITESKLTDTLYVMTQRSDGSDTLLLNRGIGLSAFSLPVSYQHPEDVLLFFTHNTSDMWTVDSVWIKKDDIPHFESVDCPAHFFHQITAVRTTHQAIDTIIVNDPSVTYDPSVTHLQIIFK